MKNTKEKILHTALQLFNSMGLSKVTLRTIANKMEISQGNLNYHFKKREDIIEALYFELVASIDAEMSKMVHTKPSLELLFHLSGITLLKFYDYRFLFLDFTQVMRENEKIKNHYKKLLHQREQQISLLTKALITENIIRKEELPNEYANLFKRTQIFADFWISSLIIENKILSKKNIAKFSTLFHQSIYPYLTEKGKENYIKII